MHKKDARNPKLSRVSSGCKNETATRPKNDSDGVIPAADRRREISLRPRLRDNACPFSSSDKENP
jgi:hypothetical protein